jgi:hypothetical protein
MRTLRPRAFVLGFPLLCVLCGSPLIAFDSPSNFSNPFPLPSTIPLVFSNRKFGQMSAFLQKICATLLVCTNDNPTARAIGAFVGHRHVRHRRQFRQSQELYQTMPEPIANSQ